MYPNNIYVKNHAELQSYGMDIGISLDMYDEKHGLKHDDRARAEYCYWRAEQTGVEELCTPEQHRLLGI